MITLASVIFEAGSVYLGLTAIAWLGWLYNRYKATAEPAELRWLAAATAYSVFMTFYGRYWGLLVPFCIAGQAALIIPVLSNTISTCCTSLSSFHSLESTAIDLSDARLAHKQGQTTAAISLILLELKKDPGHYEANYLLAQLYWERQEVLPALFCLYRILDNPQCLEQQKKRAQEEIDQAVTLAQKRGWLPANASQDDIRLMLPSPLFTPSFREHP